MCDFLSMCMKVERNIITDSEWACVFGTLRLHPACGLCRAYWAGLGSEYWKVGNITRKLFLFRMLLNGERERRGGKRRKFKGKKISFFLYSAYINTSIVWATWYSFQRATSDPMLWYVKLESFMIMEKASEFLALPPFQWIKDIWLDKFLA